MRKLFTILATAGVLMAGSLIWKAEASPMTCIGSLPTLTKPIENVYYYRRGYYGQAAVPPGTPCREAARLQFPTDRKARHAFRHECKQAWKAQKKAA